VADQGRADVPVHAGAQPIQVGAQQRVGGIRTGRVGQGAGAGRLRRVPRRLRGGAQPPGPDRRVGGELGRTRPRGRGCLVPAAGGGPPGHGIKRAGYGIVRAVGGGGEVPGAPVGVAAQGTGQGPVGGAALRAGGRAVHRRAHQRVIQREHVAVDAQQAGLLDRVEGIVTGVEAAGGVPDHGQPGGVIGRGHQQETLRGLGQPLVPVQKRPLDTAGERQLFRQRRPAGQLVAGQHLAQLAERQRIAAGGDDEPVPHRGVHVPCHIAAEQLTGRLAAQPAKIKARQLAGVEAGRDAVARGEQQRDPFGLQPAGDEQQRVGRGLVQPVSVVGDHENRALLGGLGEQAEGSEEGEKPVALALDLPEGRLQRGPLRRRKAARGLAQRPQQPLQRGERQRGLRLDTLGAEHRHAAGRRRVGQQRRLPAACHTADHEHTAGGTPGSLQQSGDGRPFGIPANQHPIQRTEPGDFAGVSRRPGRRQWQLSQSRRTTCSTAPRAPSSAPPPSRSPA
jgi:hypothetical protein